MSKVSEQGGSDFVALPPFAPELVVSGGSRPRVEVDMRVSARQFSANRRAGEGHGRWSASVAACVVAAFVFCLVGCSDAIDQARELEKAGDWEGALALYQEVLEEDPHDLNALSGAAVALTVLRRHDEALGYQELVIAADPEDALTRVELGFNYLNHQGRPDDAVRVLGEAAAIDETAKVLTFLSQAQKSAGDLEGAEKSLRRAIEVDSEYEYAYMQLAALLEEQGRFEEASSLPLGTSSGGGDSGKAQ